MTSTKHDIYIEQGATFTLKFTWNEGTPTAPLGPIDLTSITEIRMQVRTKQQTTILASASSIGVDPHISHDGAGGTITVTLPPEVTTNITAKKALYDLEVEWPSGWVDRVLEGAAITSPNITQDAGEPVVR